MKHSIRHHLSRWLTLTAVATLGVGVGGFAGLGDFGGAVRPVKAATDMWTTTKSVSGADFPEPLDPDTLLPAYVPFDQAMTIDGIAAGSDGIGSSSKVLQNPIGNQVAVQVTNSTTQSGSIWSTSTLSLRQSWATKMHIYFGSNSDPADGLAFALAGARPTVIGNRGAGIGVWGIPSKALAGKRAGELQNAFAITFDTYNNGDNTDANVKPVSAQHVAWGYPSLKEQYTSVTSQTLAFDTSGSANGGLAKVGKLPVTSGLGGYTVLSNGDKFTDGKWHTVEVKWVPNGGTGGGGTLTFSVAVSASTTITKSLTWSDADLTTVFGSSALTKGVYWGFTGSTGNQWEEGLVTFETIPGLVDGGVSATVTNPDGTAASDVYQGTTLAQTYKLTYNGSTSKQDWPVQSTGNTTSLTATLRTTDDYAFQLDDNNQISVTIKDDKGKTLATMPANPAAPHQVTDIYGNTKTYSDQLTVPSLPAFLKANGDNQSYTVTVPIVATAETAAAATAGAGVVVGSNARYTTTVKTPAIVANPLQLIAPNFQFGSFSIAQMIKGLNAVSGTAGNITVAAPTNSHVTLTAQMGNTHLLNSTAAIPMSNTLSFTYNGAKRVLQSNAAAVTLFSGNATPPSGAITNATLTTAPYPQIQPGTYQTDITWTIAVTPIVP
ncbi:lectin-like domain-containing protein [Lacticaseibacillus suihuaensis]